MGDNPNDWLDARDRLVEKLSTIANIKINHKDPDEPMIFFQGKIFIQGDIEVKNEK